VPSGGVILVGVEDGSLVILRRLATKLEVASTTARAWNDVGAVASDASRILPRKDVAAVGEAERFTGWIGLKGGEDAGHVVVAGREAFIANGRHVAVWNLGTRQPIAEWAAAAEITAMAHVANTVWIGDASGGVVELSRGRESSD
jgi:hypothetical protein